jgi:magnesium chelatase family protein
MMRRRYLDRISGPIRDRIDIHRTLAMPSRPEIARAVSRSQSTQQLAERVAHARKRQAARFDGTPWRVNSDVPGAVFRKHWPVDDAARSVMEGQLNSQKLSARSVDRILALSWSLADLREHDRPTKDDAVLASSLRRGVPLGSGLRELVAAS